HPAVRLDAVDQRRRGRGHRDARLGHAARLRPVPGSAGRPGAGRAVRGTMGETTPHGLPGVFMAIATPEVYAEMLDRAKAGSFAYPAVNVTSSQTLTAALQGFAEAESDGIIQVSVGGAEYASGATIKDRIAGSLALAAYAREVAKNYPITVALHTDHCVKKNLDSWVRPLLAL